jgi:hypothetical protein
MAEEETGGRGKPRVRLSDREMHALRDAAAGMSVADISREMNISKARASDLLERATRKVTRRARPWPTERRAYLAAVLEAAEYWWHEQHKDDPPHPLHDSNWPREVRDLLKGVRQHISLIDPAWPDSESVPGGYARRWVASRPDDTVRAALGSWATTGELERELARLRASIPYEDPAENPFLEQVLEDS